MYKKLILLRGAPGSGKSFLAKRLAGRLGGKIYSADNMLMTDEKYVWTPSLAAVAHQIVLQLVELAMVQKEKVIVIDNTNLRPNQGRPYIDLAVKYQYNIEIREPNTDWRYDVQKLIDHGTHSVPKEVIENMVETWKNVPLAMFKQVLKVS